LTHIINFLVLTNCPLESWPRPWPWNVRCG